MVCAMEIPAFPFKIGPGFLQEPQGAGRQQVNSDLRTKANAVGAEARTAGPARGQAQGGTAAPVSIQGLEEAVRTLTEEGRVPPRGSLLDLSA